MVYTICRNESRNDKKIGNKVSMVKVKNFSKEFACNKSNTKDMACFLLSFKNQLKN